MSFVVLPPEVNSGLMYSGPGSGTLIGAATAWQELAESLVGTGSSMSSVLSGLQGPWLGPSAEAMTGAVSPFVGWLHGTAAQAAQMGAQASAAASAYEMAHAGVVPPPMIEANRSLLGSLIATNFFGQNTPAIGATEAHYGEMWAQDGATMDTYLAHQQANTSLLQKPTQPPPTTSNFGQDQLSAVQPQPLTSDSGSAAAQPAATPVNPSGFVQGAGNTAGGISAGSQLAQELAGPARLASVPVRIVATVTFSVLIRLFIQLATAGAKGAGGAAGAAGLAGSGGAEGLMANIGSFVDDKLHGAVGTLANHFSSATNQISAKLGNAASLGQLKVPESWASTVTRAAPVLPDVPIGAGAAGPSGPPIPGGGQFGQALMGAMGGRGIGAIAGKAPKMAPKPQSSGGRSG